MNDALLAERLGADAVGFIFYHKSKRYVEPQVVSRIIAKLSPFTLKIGVFVNEPVDSVNDISKGLKLNAVQLHGDETPKYSASVILPVIKSFRVKDGFNFNALNKYNRIFYLLDSYSKEEYGGTGKSFDWSIIPNEIKSKIILAGGISSNNIEEIIKNLKPAAVDVSSSLEKEPGIKDEKKMNDFFKKVKLLGEQQC